MAKAFYTFLFFFVLTLFFSGKSYAADSAQVIFSTDDPIVLGQNIEVDVFIDSNTEVNAAQIKVLYPGNEFSLVSVNSQTSDFTIKAEETIEPGSITIARGNIQPLKGKKLLTTLVLNPKSGGASVSNLGYDQFDSLVMSVDNVNILSGSKVSTVKPVTPTPTQQEIKKSQGFFFYVKQAIGEFFQRLFRW